MPDSALKFQKLSDLGKDFVSIAEVRNHPAFVAHLSSGIWQNHYFRILPTGGSQDNKICRCRRNCWRSEVYMQRHPIQGKVYTSYILTA